MPWALVVLLRKAAAAAVPKAKAMVDAEVQHIVIVLCVGQQEVQHIVTHKVDVGKFEQFKGEIC